MEIETRKTIETITKSKIYFLKDQQNLWTFVYLEQEKDRGDSNN